jgi:hypothetical protein
LRVAAHVAYPLMRSGHNRVVGMAVAESGRRAQPGAARTPQSPAHRLRGAHDQGRAVNAADADNRPGSTSGTQRKMRKPVRPRHHAPGDRATSRAGDTFEIAEYVLPVEDTFCVTDRYRMTDSVERWNRRPESVVLSGSDPIAMRAKTRNPMVNGGRPRGAPVCTRRTRRESCLAGGAVTCSRLQVTTSDRPRLRSPPVPRGSLHVRSAELAATAPRRTVQRCFGMLVSGV